MENFILFSKTDFFFLNFKNTEKCKIKSKNDIQSYHLKLCL